MFGTKYHPGTAARGTRMPQLHQRGVDLLLNVMDAAEHVEKLSHDDMRRILEEVAEVLGELLKRDVPVKRGGMGGIDG
jgi:hypothetical protein